MTDTTHKTIRSHKTMLSEHFSKDEMSYSRIAVENGLDNEPSPEVLHALGYLALHLLEPLRRLYNAPIAILSGYRSVPVNRLAGGVAASQHRKGEAADCYVPEGPGYLLSLLIKSGLVFDQAIVYKKRRFLHLSLKEKGGNRMLVLLYILCLVFLLPSCRIRRSGIREEYAFRTDSSVVSGKDSSLLNRKTFITDTMNWNITRVVFSPPDSTGRQYPAEITLLEGNRHHTLTDTISKTNHLSVESARRQTAITACSSQNQYKQSSYPVWIWGVGAVVLIGGYVLFKIFSVNHKNVGVNSIPKARAIRKKLEI